MWCVPDCVLCSVFCTPSVLPMYTHIPKRLGWPLSGSLANAAARATAATLHPEMRRATDVAALLMRRYPTAARRGMCHPEAGGSDLRSPCRPWLYRRCAHAIVASSSHRPGLPALGCESWLPRWWSRNLHFMRPHNSTTLHVERACQNGQGPTAIMSAPPSVVVGT